MKTATRQAAGFGIRVLAALVLAAMLAAGTAQAAENIATNSGNWEAAAIWSAGVIPASDHDVVIPTNITVTMNGLTTRQINSLTITGTLTHAANAGTVAHKIILDVVGDVTVASGGAINVGGRGLVLADTSAGYGYGGEGGGNGTYTPAYGAIKDPVDAGRGSSAGPGGGGVSIEAVGTVTVAGSIGANGVKPPGTQVNKGGGSGGTISIRAAGLSGSGTISANGGGGVRRRLVGRRQRGRRRTCGGGTVRIRFTRQRRVQRDGRRGSQRQRRRRDRLPEGRITGQWEPAGR